MEEERECQDCGESKPLTDFPLASSGTKRYRRRSCIPCYAKKRLEYADANRDHTRAKARQYYRDNTEQVKASVKRASTKYRASLKGQVLEAYGRECECCGENHPLLLTVDHVGGGGNTHRKQLKAQGKSNSSGIYAWLRDNGWPAGFRILCWNCNLGVHLNKGVCPHEQDRNADHG